MNIQMSMMKNLNDMHRANQVKWNASSENWAKNADSRGLWKRCPEEPALVLDQVILNHLKGISGKSICVLGSGDNEAAFALAGMGAQVTSVDISQRQLDVAAERAQILNLDIAFVQSDVTHLNTLSDQSFDVVFTGGHVAVWVSDLMLYYREASRILKPDGLFIIDEYHPFRRIWKESKTELEVEMSYFKRGPFTYAQSDNVLYPEKGELVSYEFHWTVADFMNAVIKNDCRILEVHEFGEKAESWEGAPMNGLPHCLVIIAQKQSE
jgi:ubiquinone/menaquinone biosynthesis C-methylase UbiE